VRGGVGESSEASSEVGLVVEAAVGRNLGDRRVGLGQHLRGRVDPHSQDVLGGADPEHLLHTTVELAVATSSGGRQAGDAEGFAEMVADVAHNVLQLLEDHAL